ncbi:MAG: tail fiber domain-containing protein [Rhodothermales bacterium]
MKFAHLLRTCAIPPLILFVAILLGISRPAGAQIELDSAGRIGVGSATPVSNTQLKLSTSLAGGISIFSTGSSGADTYGLYSSISTGGTYQYGVYGEASTSATKNYGSAGKATGATHNYGSYGIAGSGSAIGAYGWALSGTTRYGIYGGVTSPGASDYGVYSYGNMYTTGTLTQMSDGRFKRDISGIPDNIKSGLLSSNPARYRFATSAELTASGLPEASLSSGIRYGFVAQEMQVYLPELVTNETLTVLPPDEDALEPSLTETLGINYIELIPILVAIVQDQQAQIEALQTAVRGAGIELPDSESDNK